DTNGASLVHSLLGCSKDVFTDVGLHVGVVLPGIRAVGLDNVSIPLVFHSDFAVVAESGAGAVDPHWELVGTGTRGVGVTCGLLQREAVRCLVGLPEASVRLAVRGLCIEENLLHPRRSMKSGIRNLPRGPKTAFGTTNGNLRGSLGNARTA
ncbi:MAG: hypothetical protein DRQ39_05610, partial [Gammaproteobacteria bacterium]